MAGTKPISGILKRSGILLIAGAVLLVLWRILSILHYTCPFQRFFGIPCAGCGMTRAFYRFISLDFLGTWVANPLFYVLIFYGGIFAWAYLFDRMQLVKNKVYIGSLCVLILGFWAFRLIAL